MRRPNLQSADGFSLMELLVVLAIMGLLATLVLPHVMGALGKAKTQTTDSQIEQLGAALDMFKVDNERYPTTEEGLAALVEAPAGLATWGGPYLAKQSPPLDAWKRPFHYEFKRDSYALYSLGADDRIGGTGDDADRGQAPKD
jgi:general secretion pathway protein G